MAKMIEVHCNAALAKIITTALLTYTELAYPKANKSECSQAARESLTTAVSQFEASFQEHGHGILSRRIRALVKAAIETFYLVKAENTGQDNNTERDMVLAVCQGERLSEQQLAHFSAALGSTN